MKNKITVFIMSVLTALLVSSCSPYLVSFNIGLKEVKCPSDISQRYGKQVAHSITDSLSKFGDEKIEIEWVADSTRLYFKLSNKTEYPMRVVWDEAAFVDAWGRTCGVMHLGVAYYDMRSSTAKASQLSTVIAPGSHIFDSILPAENAYFSQDRWWGWLPRETWSWKEATYLPVSGDNRERLIIDSQSLVGKSIYVILPLEICGVTNDYVFRFEVEGFTPLNFSLMK